MHFYGDPGMEGFCLAEGALVQESMTAIVRTFTPEGFVIAADGREGNPTDRSVVTDKAQKIFSISSNGGIFALSLCGTRKIVDEQRTELLFDLQEEVLAPTEALRLVQTRTPNEYVQRIVDRIFPRLLTGIERGRPSGYPDFPAATGERGRTISRVHLDGYFAGFPARLEFRLWHEKWELGEPEVRYQVLYPGAHLTYGSSVIGRALHSGEVLFSKYRWPIIASQDVTLEKAIQRSRCYIEACSHPNASSVDPDCYSIGGRMHIATVTPLEGFQWVPGFEPIGGVSG